MEYNDDKSLGYIIRDVRAANITINEEFLFMYQRTVLLALKELEYLTETQYRYAERKLAEQRLSKKSLLNEGGKGDKHD